MRKFSCPKCHKAFSRNEHLQQHLQTHRERRSPAECCTPCPVSVNSKDAAVEGEDISAGQLDFVALLSCVEEYNIPTELHLPVQVEEEVVTMDTDLLPPALSAGSDQTPANCSDILFTDEPSTINLQDLQ